jgi:hypothetical protein
LGNDLDTNIHSSTKSAEHKVFHIGTLIEIEARFRRRFNILYGIIRKVSCQRKKYWGETGASDHT